MSEVREWWTFIRYGRHWQAHERGWWWYCHVTALIEDLRDRLRPNETCFDCGLAYRRWWREVGDHDDCLPF